MNPLPPFPRLRRPSGTAAFTLAELLTVVALIVMLLGLSTSGWRVVSGMELTGAAESVVGVLSTARQHSVAYNRETRVAFFRETDDGEDRVRAFQVQEVVLKGDGDEIVRAVTPKYRLPESVVLDEEDSPLVGSQEGWEGVSLRPTGRPRGLGIATGYLVLHPRRYRGDEPSNYIVIQLNPLNGQTHLYQP